jgi:hypothetical protein
MRVDAYLYLLYIGTDGRGVANYLFLPPDTDPVVQGIGWRRTGGTLSNVTVRLTYTGKHFLCDVKRASNMDFISLQADWSGSVLDDE